MTATIANPFEDDLPVENHSGTGAGIDLSVFDAEWAEAEAPEFDELPDGKYQVKVERAELTRSQSGNPLIKWDLLVLSGGQQGRHLFKNSIISSAALPYVKGDFEKLGLKIDKLSDLPDRLPEVLDKTLEVTKRTKGEHSNVYFNRLLAITPGTVGMGDFTWN